MLKAFISLYSQANYGRVAILSVGQLITTWAISYTWVELTNAFVDAIKTDEDSGIQFWILWWLMSSICNALVVWFLQIANAHLEGELRVLTDRKSYLDILGRLQPNNRQTLDTNKFSSALDEFWNSICSTARWTPSLIEVSTKIIISTYYVARISFGAAIWVFVTYTLSYFISNTVHYRNILNKRKENQAEKSRINTRMSRLRSEYGICPSEDPAILEQLVREGEKITCMNVQFENSWTVFHLVMSITEILTTVGVILFTTYSNMITVLTLSAGMQNSVNRIIWFLGSNARNQIMASKYLDQVNDLKPHCTYAQPDHRSYASGIAMNNIDFTLTRGKDNFRLFGKKIVLTPGVTVLSGPSGQGKSTLMKVCSGGWYNACVFTDMYGYALDIQTIVKCYIGEATLNSECKGSFRSMCEHRNVTDEDMWTALEICEVVNEIRKWGGLDAPLSGTKDDSIKDTLSKGQKQRINLAAALAGRKNGTLLIIDEVVSGLAQAMARQVLCNIQNAYSNSIIVLTDHVPDNLSELRIIQTLCLNEGQISVLE